MSLRKQAQKEYRRFYSCLFVCLFVLRFNVPTIFQSCRDGATALRVLTSTLGNVCALGMPPVVIEPSTTRFGV